MATAISSRGAQVIAWSYVTFAIAAFFASLRLFVRYKIVKVVGREDVCVVCALVTALLCSVFMHLEVSEGGLGQRKDTLSDQQLMKFFQYSYLSILSYRFSLSFTKFAIIFLCLRLFAPSNWRKACLIVFWIIAVYTVWVIVSCVIPCVPVQRYWDKSVDGFCFPNAVLWFVNSGLHIFTDFLVVLLPIPGVIRLQLPLKQKIGVCLVFTLGFFVCIISVVRLYALKTGATATDQTYDNFEIAIWSVIEVNAAVVGACLPTLKPLITRLFPRLLSSGRSRPTYPSDFYHRTEGTNRRPRPDSLGEPTPDFSSTREFLDEDGGVALSDLDTKSARVRQTETNSPERRSSSVGNGLREGDDWSGLSDQPTTFYVHGSKRVAESHNDRDQKRASSVDDTETKS